MLYNPYATLYNPYADCIQHYETKTAVVLYMEIHVFSILAGNMYYTLRLYCYSHVLTHTGYHPVAPNGFVNGMGDELEQNEDDAYPEDGPLHSGTHSLRRIRNTTTTKTPLVS